MPDRVYFICKFDFLYPLGYNIVYCSYPAKQQSTLSIPGECNEIFKYLEF
mgnify:CR=1 FL=1